MILDWLRSLVLMFSLLLVPFRSEQTVRPSKMFLKIKQNVLIFSNGHRGEWWEKVGQGLEEVVHLFDISFISGQNLGTFLMKTIFVVFRSV